MTTLLAVVVYVVIPALTIVVICADAAHTEQDNR